VRSIYVSRFTSNDADAHKLEIPSAAGISEPQYRDRIGLGDRLGDQRARIVDFNPATGKTDFMRMFTQPGAG